MRTYPLNSFTRLAHEIDGWSRPSTGREMIECTTRAWSNGYSSSSSQSNPTTYTTSGTASPIVSGSSGAVAGTGSIALGSGAKYQESGSIDLTGANIGGVGGNITASSGSNVTIGDAALASDLSSVLNNLQNGGAVPITVVGGATGGGGATGSLGTSGTIGSILSGVNWTLVAIIGAAALVLYGIFGHRK